MKAPAETLAYVVQVNPNDDGKPDMIRVILRSKGLDRLFVVSDAAPLAGSAPGVYDSLGGTVRVTAGGRIETFDGAYLAGSTATMADCLRHLRSLVRQPPVPSSWRFDIDLLGKMGTPLQK